MFFSVNWKPDKNGLQRCKNQEAASLVFCLYQKHRRNFLQMLRMELWKNLHRPPSFSHSLPDRVLNMGDIKWTCYIPGPPTLPSSSLKCQSHQKVLFKGHNGCTKRGRSTLWFLKKIITIMWGCSVRWQTFPGKSEVESELTDTLESNLKKERGSWESNQFIPSLRSKWSGECSPPLICWILILQSRISAIDY